MPVRYMVLDRVTPAAFDYSFYPCDLYYADVAKDDGSFDDWNAQKDGFHAQYFGEVRGEKNKNDPINYDQIHYRPELALGRWPVNTPEEVRTVVAKTIGFENRIAAQPPSERACGLDLQQRLDRRARRDGPARPSRCRRAGRSKSDTIPTRRASRARRRRITKKFCAS